jgi:hypothetical protein
MRFPVVVIFWDALQRLAAAGRFPIQFGKKEIRELHCHLRSIESTRLNPVGGIDAGNPISN